MGRTLISKKKEEDEDCDFLFYKPSTDYSRATVNHCAAVRESVSAHAKSMMSQYTKKRKLEAIEDSTPELGGDE